MGINEIVPAKDFVTAVSDRFDKEQYLEVRYPYKGKTADTVLKAGDAENFVRFLKEIIKDLDMENYEIEIVT